MDVLGLATAASRSALREHSLGSSLFQQHTRVVYNYYYELLNYATIKLGSIYTSETSVTKCLCLQNNPQGKEMGVARGRWTPPRPSR